MSYDAPPPPPPPSYGQPMYGGAPSGGDGGALRGATLQQAVQRFFQKYAEFNGRASRSEFWYWALVAFIVNAILQVLEHVSGLFGILGIIWGLGTICPSLALGARRLHDIGRSGWWQLLVLIPCIGWIILIVWNATPPKPEGAKYNNVV